MIPKVVMSLPQRRPAGADEPQPWVMPTTCPICETTLVRGEEEAVWRCENTSCPARLRRSLEHFASRRAMNIEGFGESLVDSVVTQGLVKDPADVYALTADQLAALERMGKKSAANVVREIDKSRQAGLSRVVYALGIRHVGERGAAALAGAFGSMPGDLRRLGRAAPGGAGRRAGGGRLGADLARRAGQPAPDRAPGARRAST